MLDRCVIVWMVAGLAVAAGCRKKNDAGSAQGGAAAAGSAAAGSAAAGSLAVGSAAVGAAAVGSAAAGSAAAGSAAPAAAYCGADPCPCKAGSEQKQGDKLTMCELEKAVKVGSVDCQPGRLLFHDDGSLEECLPAAETKIGDYTCKPSPLTVAWHKGGALRACSLAKDATIGGVAIKTGQGIVLFPDGKLKSGWANAPVMIDSWSCGKGMYLFDDGKLEACTVLAAGKVGPQDVPAGSMIRLTKDAKLRGLEMGAKGSVGGKPAKQGDRFCFDEAGKVAQTQSCWMF